MDLFSEARFYRELGAAPQRPHTTQPITRPSTSHTAQAMIIMDDVVDMGGQFSERAPSILSGHDTRFADPVGSASRFDLGLGPNLSYGVAFTTDPRHDRILPRGISPVDSSTTAAAATSLPSFGTPRTWSKRCDALLITRLRV